MEEMEEGKEEMPEMDEMLGTEGTVEIETAGEVKDRREMGTERMKAKKRRKTRRGTTTGRTTGKRMSNVEMEGEMEIDLNEREVDVVTSKKVRMRDQRMKGGRKMSGLIGIIVNLRSTRRISKRPKKTRKRDEMKRRW
jgi:hypothetical protein